MTAIYAPGINVCVWERPPSAAIAEYVAALQALRPFRQRLLVSPGAPDATELLAGLPAAAPGRQAFLADVARLIEIYGDLTGAAEVGVCLNRLDGAMCPRFHVDRVLVRLVCTYAGPGTEWLDNADADRSKLEHRPVRRAEQNREVAPSAGRDEGAGWAPAREEQRGEAPHIRGSATEGKPAGAPGTGASDAASGLLRRGARVQRMDRFAVGLLKGEAWPDNAGNGAIHRSPAAGAQQRLMLTIDGLA